MILDKLVYEVLTEAREMSDDGTITAEYVTHLIDVYRAKYIQQEYSKRNLVNQISIQSINVPLTAVDSSNDQNVATGSVVLKSEVLPNILNISKRPAIIRIRTLDAVKGEIAFMGVDRAKLSSYSKFKTLNAFLETDNKLVVVGNKASAVLIGNVTLDLVLESPADMYGWNFSENLGADHLVDYPIDLGMWAYIKDELLRHILMSYQVPNDNANNQVDDKELGQQRQRSAKR